MSRQQEISNWVKKPPKKFLNSRYRANQWKNAKRILQKIRRVLPVTSISIIGSFTTDKKNPADVDCIIFIKISEKTKDVKWAVDLTVAPDNDYGQQVLREVEEWVKRKYGLKKSPTIKLI